MIAELPALLNVNDFPFYDKDSRFPHTPEQLVAMSYSQLTLFPYTRGHG